MPTVPEQVVAPRVVRNDGSVPFVAPQPGVTPTAAAHLTTKAYVDSVAAGQLPVGFVFISVVATNPGTLLGYGTWVAIAAGRVLVGIDAGDAAFDTVRETGGAKTVAAAGTVAAPTLSGNTASESGHTHDVNVADAAEGDLAEGSGNHFAKNSDVSSSGGTAHSHGAGTLAASAPAFTGSPTSVVQPYYTVYMWERTA